MAKIVQGEGAEVEAKPKGDLPSNPTPPPLEDHSPVDTTNDSSNLIPIMKLYLQGFEEYRKRNNSVGYETFSSTDVLPYAPYLRFRQESPGNFGVTVRPLTPAEFVTAVKSTSPQLGEVLELSDILENVPESINILNDRLIQNQFPSSLNLSQERGIVNVTKFVSGTRNFLLIPSLEVLSLFMSSGSKFRDYLKNTGVTVALPAYFFGTMEENTRLVSRRVSNFVEGSKLFSPENILSYLKSGNKAVREMIQEYEVLVGKLSSFGTNNPSALFDYAFERIKASNPHLVL